MKVFGLDVFPSTGHLSFLTCDRWFAEVSEYFKKQIIEGVLQRSHIINLFIEKIFIDYII